MTVKELIRELIDCRWLDATVFIRLPNGEAVSIQDLDLAIVPDDDGEPWKCVGINAEGPSNET
jgi:hypothetical protein